MSQKYLKIFPLLKYDIDFGVPVLAVSGLIYSIWATDYFWLAMKIRFNIASYNGTDYIMSGAFSSTHYILALITAILLYIGFKNSNRYYIRQWYNFKLFETIMVIIGALLFFSISYGIFAVIILVAGRYVILSVKQGFAEIPSEDVSLESVHPEEKQKIETAENPPPYNEVMNDKTEDVEKSNVISIES